MASFAGFLVVYAFDVLGFDPDAEELVTDIAELGRTNGIGDVPPGFGEVADVDEGC